MNHILIRESFEDENQSYYCKHTKDGERLLVEERCESHPDLNESEDPQIDSLGSFEIPIRPTPCLLYTSPSPRDGLLSRMPSSA